MKDFMYSYPTKVYFGDGAAKKALQTELAGIGKTIMLAYGGGSVKKNGVYDEISRYLKEAGKEIVDFSGIMPNPTYKKVQEGAALAREKGVSFILALGGGSVIDCCKIIAAQAVTEKDIWKMEFEDHVYPTEYLPMGAIVTASGTGAEMNNGAVITNAALQAAIQDDIKDNRKPFVVIASAGTTNTGSIDPMAEIAVLCRKYDMWMHVDGAFGASVLLSEQYRENLSGIELSDSLSWDAHKWLLQTYGCSMVLVRNRSVLVQSFATHPEYLKDAESAEGSIEFWDLGVELTRPARGLKLWLTLQVLGSREMGRIIEHGCAMAELAEKIIREQPDWEIVSPAQLGIVCFRYVSNKAMGESDLGKINQEISREITESGYAQIFTTELQGKKVLRMCTINPETTERDICETIERLEKVSAVSK